MRTFAVLSLIALAAFAAAAPVPLPSAREAGRLIELLGSEDFAEREAATRRLETLGPLALDALRAACTSDDPEVAERAKILVRKIEYRIASEHELKPTMVELDVNECALDDSLAALSRQSGFEVVLGGVNREKLAARKITLATGKVPFWKAVVKICDVADVQVAVVCGVGAPGAMPYLARAGKGDSSVRVAERPARAVVLEARDHAKKRPASVHGAVLIEAIEPPWGASANLPNTLLLIWPEPTLNWQSLTRLAITKANDGAGQKLTHVVPQVPVPKPDRTKDTSKVDVLAALTGTDEVGSRGGQVQVKLKSGAVPSPRVCELSGSVYGQVRAFAEPLVSVRLDSKQKSVQSGKAGVQIRATPVSENGKQYIDITLEYDPVAVKAARNDDEGVTRHGDNAGHGRVSVEGGKLTLGVRVTDSDWKPFETSLVSVTDATERPDPRRQILNLRLEVAIPKERLTTPAAITFWGSLIKHVEVPFTLKDVPLVGGPR